MNIAAFTRREPYSDAILRSILPENPIDAREIYQRRVVRRNA